MGDPQPAQSLSPAPILRYEDVPQRVAVVRNGDFVELIIPSHVAWRVVVVRQAIWAGLMVLGWTVYMSVPMFLGAGRVWLFYPTTVLVVTALAFVALMIYRLHRAPATTVLQWDGQTLRAPSYVMSAGNDRTAGDPVKWSKAALSDIQVLPLRPVWLTGCGTVRVVSRFDYPLSLGAYPLEPLKRAVEEFRAIVLAPSDSDERVE